MFFLFFRYWFAFFPLLFHFVFFVFVCFFYVFFHFCFRFFPRVVYMFEGLGHQVTWERKSTTKQAEKKTEKKNSERRPTKKKRKERPLLCSLRRWSSSWLTLSTTLLGHGKTGKTRGRSRKWVENMGTYRQNALDNMKNMGNYEQKTCLFWGLSKLRCGYRVFLRGGTMR